MPDLGIVIPSKDVVMSGSSSVSVQSGSISSSSVSTQSGSISSSSVSTQSGSTSSSSWSTSSTSFTFPDHIFPPVESSFPGLPLNPIGKISKLENDYKLIAVKVGTGKDPEQIHSLFRWAREALDFAESHHGLSQHLIDTAVDIIKLIVDSSSQKPPSSSSKFYGAANYIVGIWYLFGLFGTPLNPNLSMEKFLMAAKQGYSRALYRLGAFYENAAQVTPALTYFEHGIKRGDAACYYRMAIAYLRGQLGKSVNIKLGLEYLERSSLMSDPDCAQAAYIYGLVQLGEIDILSGSAKTDNRPLDPEAGILALERSAWLGFGPALLRMGKSWQGGEKGYDCTIALRYFHLCSRQDQYSIHKDKVNNNSKINKGSLLGVPEVEISKWMVCGYEGVFSPNEEWAFKFALMAADQENSTGEFAVGYYYEVGIYVDVNIEKAMKYYTLSAQHGFNDAKSRLDVLQNELRKEVRVKPTTQTSTTIPTEDNNQSIGVIENANTSNIGTIKRRLTRKDHERSLSLSIRGKGKANSEQQLHHLETHPEPPVPTFTYKASPYNSPPVSRTPSPQRKLSDGDDQILFEGNNLSDRLPQEQNQSEPQIQSPFSQEQFQQQYQPLQIKRTREPPLMSPSSSNWGTMNTLLPSRSPSPGRGHKHSASVVEDRNTSTLESRMNPRKVSSPVRPSVIPEDSKPRKSLTSNSSLYPPRTPSPIKFDSQLDKPIPNPTQIVQVGERKKQPFQLSSVPPPRRSVSGQLVSRMPDVASISDAATDTESLRKYNGSSSSTSPTHPLPSSQQYSDVLYRVVPLKVKKSTELLQRHSFPLTSDDPVDEQQSSNARQSPDILLSSPSGGKEDPTKRYNTSPGNTSRGSIPSLLDKSPAWRPESQQRNIRPYASHPILKEGDNSVNTSPIGGSQDLRSSGSIPMLKKFEFEEVGSEVTNMRDSIISSPVTTENSISDEARKVNLRSPMSERSLSSKLATPGSSPSLSVSPGSLPSRSPVSIPSRSPVESDIMRSESPYSRPVSTTSSSSSSIIVPRSNSSSPSGGPISNFSRISTVSSTNTTVTTATASTTATTTSSASASSSTSSTSSSSLSVTEKKVEKDMKMAQPRVALTFDEMGIATVQDEKDCVIM